VCLHDPEVEDLDDLLLVVVPREEDVARLQIAMHEAVFVSAAQRLAERREDRGQLSYRQAPLAIELRPEVLAFEELHHEVGRVSLHAKIEHLHHVRRPERGRDPRLSLEPRAVHVRHLPRQIHHLDGDLVVEEQVPRRPDGPHSALPELPFKA
jgi:hypothetical protein